MKINGQMDLYDKSGMKDDDMQTRQRSNKKIHIIYIHTLLLLRLHVLCMH